MYADTQEHSLKHHKRSKPPRERSEPTTDECIYAGEIETLRPEITAFLKPSNWIDPNHQKYF